MAFMLTFVLQLILSTTDGEASKKYLCRAPNPSLKGYVQTTDALLTISRCTDISCCQHCHLDDQCAAFFWSKLDSECYLMHTLYTNVTANMVSQAGALYFNKVLPDVLASKCIAANYVWVKHLKFCFKLYDTQVASVDQQQAIQKCQNLGHRLVITKTKEQHEFLKNVIVSSARGFSGYWVDGKHFGYGAWRYSDGSNVNPSLWAPEKPTYQYQVDCAIMGMTYQYDWENTVCTNVNKYICEVQ